MFVLVLARVPMRKALPGSWWGLAALPLAAPEGYGDSRVVKRHAMRDIAFVTRFFRETMQAR